MCGTARTSAAPPDTVGHSSTFFGGGGMTQNNITLLYDALTALGAKRDAARNEYTTALFVSNAIAATQAWRRWKFAEQELVLAAMKCDRRLVPR